MKYYCEMCLNHKGSLVTMREVYVTTHTGVRVPYYRCYNCGQEWPINKGQARHVVSNKLKMYKRLAKRLGMDE